MYNVNTQGAYIYSGEVNDTLTLVDFDQEVTFSTYRILGVISLWTVIGQVVLYVSF